ncbi:hypothetical protein [Pseudochelatococcus sp. G4_1912]|uniref:hypothetical protein n=1 Tax=Pseudochelatococcus sp. G4_1912 TaxID=3114288 RepID=UPI0039C67DE0
MSDISVAARTCVSSNTENTDLRLAKSTYGKVAAVDVKKYSTILSAIFGRVFSFIWHNHANKELKSLYLANVKERVSNIPGGEDFLRGLEKAINKNSGTPLRGSVVAESETVIQELLYNEDISKISDSLGEIYNMTYKSN